jgi:hypothetical protein
VTPPHPLIPTRAQVRYVYRPVESLLLVMITNKHSNIVEDLETLRLFAQVKA